MKTVKEISIQSGVSIRTLRYYDRIGLLKPAFVGENGYRYYDETTFEKLQEILLFKELDFSLKEIKEIITSESYNKEIALEKQIHYLELKKKKLEKIIHHAKALCIKEKEKRDFSSFNPSYLDQFKKETEQLWGKTSAYEAFISKKFQTPQLKNLHSALILFFKQFSKLTDYSVNDPIVQNQVANFQVFISNHFYPCDDQMLSYLGKLYIEDKRFTQTIDQLSQPNTAQFISEAIAHFINTKSSTHHI